METRDFALKIKALEPSGAFEGLAAVYGELDRQNDVIMPGAFAQAVAQQGLGYPLLWSHKQDEPIGLASISDSRDALHVYGRLLLEDPAAARAYAHLKAGTVRGLSIGYTLPRGDKMQRRADGVRLLREIHLHEISVVSVPAQQSATVFSVKSLDDVRVVLADIGGDITPEQLAELASIDRELKRLLVARDSEENAKAETLAELRAFAAQLHQFAGR